MNTSKMRKSALASAVAVAVGISAVPQTSVADITLTFQDNLTPSLVPLPFAHGGSSAVAFAPGTEFRVMTPAYATNTNDGFKDAIFGGETWTFDNSEEMIAVAGVAVLGNPGACQTVTCSNLTEGIAGFPICSAPSSPNCPVLEQGADFLGAGDFNFLAPVKGSIPGNIYGVATIDADLSVNNLVVHFPVTNAQWADGSYVIGGDPNPNPTIGDTCAPNGPCGGPGVDIGGPVTVTSAPGAADITLDFVLHGESIMQFDEVTVGGFNKNSVQWELPGTATINNQDPVANDDGSVGSPLPAVPGVATPVNVLANDSDPDHAFLNSTAFDTLVVNSVGACDNGGVLTNNTTDVTYQSAALFSGIETCTYTTGDGRTGVSTSATITMNPTSGETPPTGNADGPGGAFATSQGIAVSVDVLANDTDAQGDALTVSRVDAASTSGGIVTIINGGVEGGNNVMYTPVSGFNGTDSFTYDVMDNDGTAANITVQILVTPFTESSAGTVTVSNVITAGAIPVVDPDSTSSCQGGCFQVEVTAVPPGGQVEILAPKRSSGYSQGSTFRHFVDSTQLWEDHELPDTVQTAPEDGMTGLCPGLASGLWRVPTVGDTCTKYTLTDNGPNDDNPVLGEIRDPVGFAQPNAIRIPKEEVISATGCSLNDTSNTSVRNGGHWLLLGGFLAFLRLFRRSNQS